MFLNHTPQKHAAQHEAQHAGKTSATGSSEANTPSDVIADVQNEENGTRTKPSKQGMHMQTGLEVLCALSSPCMTAVCSAGIAVWFLPVVMLGKQQGNGSTNQFMNNQFNQQINFGRGDSIGPNRSSSMGMGSDISGGNFHPQMNNMSQRGPGGNMIPNHMNQMNYMNQQRMNMSQQMNNQTNANQMSQQQMHQMQQHQRMLNHQRMMMMNAAHHNNSHSQLMRPSGPNMSKSS